MDTWTSSLDCLLLILSGSVAVAQPGCRLTVYGAAFVSNFHLASRSDHLLQLFSVNSRDQWTKYPAQAPEAPGPDFNTPVLNFCKRRDRMYSCRLPLWVQIKFSWIQYDPRGFHWSMSLRVVHAYFLASTYSPTMPYVFLDTRKAFSWGGWGEAMKHEVKITEKGVRRPGSQPHRYHQLSVWPWKRHSSGSGESQNQQAILTHWVPLQL